MTHDGDNAEDDGLKALRSVWLSMPDEDPPERGLAELMAAARVKAETMVKPSLWHRVVATLRRPPVLALATVMVVLGGAALVARHRDKLDVSPTVSSPEAPAQTIRADQTLEAPPAAPLAVPAAGSGAPPPEAAEATAADQAATPPPADKKEKAAAVRAEAKSAALEPPPPPPRHESAKHASSTSSTSSFGGGAPHATGPSGHPGAAQAEVEMAKDDASPAPDLPNDLPNELASSVAQLHQDARDAAARGDCDTVRRTMSKIAAADARYYQQKVANDPKLAACTKKN